MVYEESQMEEKSSAAKLDILAAGITGMLAGATGVTLLALSDKDIRKKVFKHANTAKEFLIQWSFNTVHEPVAPINDAIDDSM
jgi:hypothetical protein